MIWVAFLIIFVVLMIAFYFLPAIIALCRGHGYSGAIFAVNLAVGWTALGWLVALVWSVWPKERALVEPFVGNVTGSGYRNSGDAFGAADYGRERGRREAMRADLQRGRALPGPPSLDQLEKLGSLRDSGVLTQEEFDTQKARLLRWH